MQDRHPSGTFMFYLVTAFADEYSIHVVADSQAVPRYPTLTILPGPACATTSTAHVSQLMAATAGEEFTVLVKPRDAYGCAPGLETVYDYSRRLRLDYGK